MGNRFLREATIMHVRVTILPLVLGSVLLPAERALSQDEKEFAPKNGMFTIMLPAGEKAGDRTRVLTIGKHKVPIEASQSVKDGTTFTGASIGIPAVVMRDIPADKRFEVLRDALAKALNGKVTDEKDIKQDTVPGKEYQFELPKGVARLQLYTIAGFVVYGVVEGSKEQVRSKEADAFLGSLKLTAKAKEVFGKVKR
jgi:hypothetical protein